MLSLEDGGHGDDISDDAPAADGPFREVKEEEERDAEEEDDAAGAAATFFFFLLFFLFLLPPPALVPLPWSFSRACRARTLRSSFSRQSVCDMTADAISSRSSRTDKPSI